MMRKSAILTGWLIASSLGGCSENAQQTAQPQPKQTEATSLAANSAKARSCMSDAECGPSENCYCAESDNGNCQAPGVCLPRGAPAGAANLASSEKMTSADSALSQCRNMSDLSFVPSGWHPTTARWQLSSDGSQINDLVCITQTNTQQIRVLRWLDFPLPAGYHTLRTETGVDTTFRGCRQWSTWQGQRTCAASWTLYVMEKDKP